MFYRTKVGINVIVEIRCYIFLTFIFFKSSLMLLLS